MKTNRTSLALLAALLLVTAAASAQAPRAATTAPKLVIPEMVKDMGPVAQGTMLDVAFKLVNEGDAVLEVRAVRPTCGCTVADFDKEVPAGGEGWVKAKLDTADFSGPISKSILVMTNDPDEPTARLVIKTDVRPYVEVLPRPLVRFNAIEKDHATEKLVVTPGEGVKDFKVEGISSEFQFIKTTVRQLSGDEIIAGKSEPQYEIAFSLAEDAPVGTVSGAMKVKTNHPKAPEVEVKVYGVVRALLNVTPGQVQFGAVEAKARPGRNVIVVNNRPGAEVEVTGAQVNDPAFEAAVSTIEKGKRYQVTLTVKAEAEPGSRDAVLTLNTSDPDYPRLTVPVRAVIR